MGSNINGDEIISTLIKDGWHRKSLFEVTQYSTGSLVNLGVNFLYFPPIDENCSFFKEVALSISRFKMHWYIVDKRIIKNKNSVIKYCKENNLLRTGTKLFKSGHVYYFCYPSSIEAIMDGAKNNNALNTLIFNLDKFK